MIEERIETPDRAGRRALLDVLARAFRDNPMNVAIHGADPRRRLRANRAGLAALVLDAADPIEMRVLRRDDRILGGWIAAPPGLRVLPSPSWWRQVGCLWHQGVAAMDAWGRVSGALGPQKPLADHWYLAVLGVVPDHWGEGIGGRLLASLGEVVHARASGRDEAAAIYLECDRPESVAFYRARGFETLHVLEVEAVDCWGLGRGFHPRI